MSAEEGVPLKRGYQASDINEGAVLASGAKCLSWKVGAVVLVVVASVAFCLASAKNGFLAPVEVNEVPSLQLVSEEVSKAANKKLETLVTKKFGCNHLEWVNGQCVVDDTEYKKILSKFDEKELSAVSGYTSLDDSGAISIQGYTGGIEITHYWTWGYRVRVRQPELANYLAIGNFAGIIAATAAGVAVAGPAGAALGFAISALIFFKNEHITRTDNGKGIYFDVSYYEMPLIATPSSATLWVLTKPVYPL